MPASSARLMFTGLSSMRTSAPISRQWLTLSKEQCSPSCSRPIASSQRWVAGTLVHPWNYDVCEEEDVVCAHTWRLLAAALELRCPALRRAA